MQKWEYMTWVVGYAGTGADLENNWKGGSIKYINGIAVPNWKKSTKSLVEELNRVGEEGWELLGYELALISNGFSGDPILLFKRPKP
ncbi:MAG: hypothetical protein HXX08_22455 [Chloroflexi bacterium]|uniref:DUF4177 domain-containing protein n=1 Tax=Candidatus Chlorohelix allophototropha TaxID=3003348 RepID=A0A8T7M9A6_9CHLR|nr:hypothetical protein [Chloroflexota bacterium]WJW68561.1 hypothetical protein OZ401_004175 [Chloroflexota bacterium L227-S17]